MSNFNELKEFRIERSGISWLSSTRQDVIDFLMAYVAGRLWLSFSTTHLSTVCQPTLSWRIVPCGLLFSFSAVDLQ